jgi:hypothetical protein
VRNRAKTIVAVSVLQGSIFTSWSAFAIPIGNLPISPTSQIQYAAGECPRDRCLRSYPSYYDTPPELRPRAFYGYEPHKQGDWYRHYKTWFGYDFFGYRRSWR